MWIIQKAAIKWFLLQIEVPKYDNERSPAVEASRRWNKRQGNRFIASLSTLQELLSLSFTLTVYGFVVCLLKPTRRINRKNSVKDDLFFPFVFIFLFLPTGLLFQCCLQLTASKHIELQHWNRREKPVGNKMKKIKDKETKTYSAQRVFLGSLFLKEAIFE